MTKHKVFVLAQDDRTTTTSTSSLLSERIQKCMARGRTQLIVGPSSTQTTSTETVSYQANEVLDDVSIKSDDSVEDEMDEFTPGLLALHETAIRTIWLKVQEEWTMEVNMIRLRG